MTKIIKHAVTIGAAPKKVYEILINEKKHAAFTGAKAVISRKVGGAFSCYGTYLTGFNVDLVPGKRIVQAWRSSGWPKGAYSIATFALSAARGGRTKLTFTQVGVPAASRMHINKGWQLYYWKPLKAYAEK
jgi:activator of HSP90 ATPase